MSTNRNPIGVFDSGIGGLTVAKAIKDLLPNEQVLYFGDTAHLPYGDKSPASIRKYMNQILAFFRAKEVSNVVIACNSASSVYDSNKNLVNSEDMEILDVIRPVVEHVASEIPDGHVGVIGTRRTIQSGIYKRLLKAASPSIKVSELATPLLAPMIEDGFVNDAISSAVIDEYLSELKDIDALILGCTHYPLIKKEIDKFYNGKVMLYDAPEIIAKQLSLQLGNTGNTTSDHDQFFVSDYTKSFEDTAKLFFGASIHLEEKRL